VGIFNIVGFSATLSQHVPLSRTTRVGHRAVDGEQIAQICSRDEWRVKRWSVVYRGGYLRPQLLFQLNPRRLPDRASCMIIHARQPIWMRAHPALRVVVLTLAALGVAISR
jgi:hypothetical protein